MKKTLLLALGIVMCASLAFGQGTIGMFSDAAGTNCTMSPVGYGQVYFAHHQILAPGATLAQFKVVSAGGAVVSEAGGYADPAGGLHLGTTLAGISVAYGGCKTTTFLMGSQFYIFAAAPPCSSLDIIADPAVASGQIETRDCTSGANVVLPYQNGYSLTLFPDTSCQPLPGCLPLATSEKTWGQIKALYN